MFSLLAFAILLITTRSKIPDFTMRLPNPKPESASKKQIFSFIFVVQNYTHEQESNPDDFRRLGKIARPESFCD